MQTKDVAIFGVSSYSEELSQMLPKDESVVAYIDNDSRKYRKRQGEIPVMSPGELSRDIDRVYIAAGATQDIYDQLICLGIDDSRIVKPRLLSSDNVRKLSLLENKHQNTSAIIIGNGPSLRMADLDLIQESGMVSFGFNKIYLAYKETVFRPTYYMVEDVLVAQNNKNEISVLNESTNLYADYLLRYLNEREDSILFGLSSNSNTRDDELSMNPLSFIKGGSVTCSALQMALYMGVSKIFFLGIDFDFTEGQKDPSNSNILINNEENNHFHPDYRKMNETWSKPPMAHMQAFYEYALAAAEKKGIEIINLTRGGELEVFQRDNFDCIFK